MKKISCNTHSYFAAANTFKGFKSNFHKVFDETKFERIFILKGGPGTGKSTLMKRVGERFENGGHDVTYIYCSSDPRSLDGVIIQNGTKHFAILDGTAPHTTDPKFPGAISEIINLAEGFDTASLSVQRDRIVELSNLKAAHYKSAYKLLSLAGEIFESIEDVFYSNDVYNKAELLSKEILRTNIHDTKGACEISDLYVSSFGKDGYSRLDLPCIKKDYISITGDGFTEYAVIREIKKTLAEDELTESVYYSPLTAKMIDAVITPDIIISVDKCGFINFATDSIAAGMPYEYTVMRGLYRDVMEMARNRFSKAADAHFQLEDIYSQNVDFRNNENITARIIKEIADRLL